MNETKRNVILSCLVVSGVIACVAGQTTTPDAYVVGWNEGEILLDPQGRTNSINAGPSTGFADLAVSTQDLPPGTRINLHRHDRTEEVIFVHAGSGILTIGDQRVEVREGTTIRIPPGLGMALKTQRAICESWALSAHQDSNKLLGRCSGGRETQRRN